MRILIVCQYYYPEQFAITEIAESFVARGHEVTVVTGKPNYGLNRILEGYENVTDEVINGVKVHRCNLKPRRGNTISIFQNYLSFWRSSKRYIAKMKEKFDVVYSMSLSPIISVSAANKYAKKHHVPHYLHCLDLWPESPVITGAIKKGGLLYRILYRWSKKIYAKATKVFVSSPSFVSYFRDELKLKDLPIEYIPQPSLEVGSSSEKPEFKHKHNLVYAGNIGTLQLTKELVEAAEIAAKEEDVCLHLIGMGSNEEAIKALIKERNLSSCVEFHGIKPRAATVNYYKEATGIVVSLVSKGTVGKTIPNKLTSALELGKPFLAVLGGDGRAVLEESQGAVFSLDETPEEIAKAMLALCRLDPKEKETMGQRNIAYFNEHFQKEKIIDQLLTEMEPKNS